MRSPSRRAGKLETTVYTHVGPFGTLRNLVKTHSVIVRDVVRTQNRIRAVLRSRGCCFRRGAMSSPRCACLEALRWRNIDACLVLTESAPHDSPPPYPTTQAS